MLPENIIFVGVLVNLVGLFWYIRDVIKGGTRPNLVSWFIWSLAPFIGVFFQLKAGARLSILPIFMAGFTSLVVIIVSVLKKNGYWKINSFDVVCGIISLFALILYVFTHNLSISILFAIISDGLAYIPTIRKSWNFPESETGLMYTTGIVSNIIGLLTIKMWTFPIYSFGIYIVLFNSMVVFSIYRKKILNMLYFRNDQ
ncbi:hypothetical protein A2121_00990 [Candidatus Nomurabacteria bacterium GWB1_40_6]|uniref:Uncharacterized protein n=1 Tax=Candidatus Nomurabacteria bacterium GWB1_40_6 TaxID=1801727 RepID=A0A1F6TKZ1_9BACT|nr:MAG: hypothetical protein A2121_00990 [Candidatus Nomurabacteria bacterium GWB1_40_6]